MAIKTYTFTGEATFDYVYSIQRVIYFWKVSGLEGKVKSIKLKGDLRVEDTFSNKAFNCVLFKNFKSSYLTGNASTGWIASNSSDNMYYTNTTKSQKLWFNSSYYSNFGTILTNEQQTLSLTGGAGNVSKIFNLGISTTKTDVSEWNGQTIYFGIYESGGEASTLCWGDLAAWTMEITCEIGPSFHYYNGTSWQDVKNAWYYNGSKWIEISGAGQYNGTT